MFTPRATRDRLFHIDSASIRAQETITRGLKNPVPSLKPNWWVGLGGNIVASVSSKKKARRDFRSCNCNRTNRSTVSIYLSLTDENEVSNKES